MTWPPDIGKLPPLFANLFRALIERIDAIRPIDGTGIKVTDAIGGTGRAINIFGKTGGAGSAAAALCPLRVSDATGDEGKRIKIAWGRINGGTPEEFSPRGHTYIPGMDEGYVFAKVTFSFGGAGLVSAREIVFDGDAQVNTSTVGYELLAQFELSEDSTKYSVATQCGDVDVSPCDLADPS